MDLLACLFVYFFVSLLANFLARLLTKVLVCLFVCLFVSFLVRLFVCSFTCFSACTTACSFACLCVCPTTVLTEPIGGKISVPSRKGKAVKEMRTRTIIKQLLHMNIFSCREDKLITILRGVS